MPIGALLAALGEGAAAVAGGAEALGAADGAEALASGAGAGEGIMNLIQGAVQGQGGAATEGAGKALNAGKGQGGIGQFAQNIGQDALKQAANQPSAQINPNINTAGIAQMGNVFQNRINALRSFNNMG